MKLVYTAMSRHSAYAKEIACTHVFLNGAAPLNPFMLFGYFLYDLVDRDLVRSANKCIVDAAYEIWCYGPIANGCLEEILQGKETGKPIRFFTIAPHVSDIIELDQDSLTFETDEIKRQFIEYTR
jgi:hypothetical protein